ncbi:MAG: flagellar export protein FliJ [Lachnospiraceae bacterium]|jgi:flagellar FliJ protein|nr:flagellar export protein FliJ [Lachnospiraceae bacterium]MEE3460453.1 flagellar export protein FliJ [Lachnospiraceae bacterium]
MARFKFRLNNLLNIKIRLEDQAKAEYGMEQIKLNEEEEKLLAVIARKDGSEALLKNALTGNIDVLDIEEKQHGLDVMKLKVQEQTEARDAQRRRTDAARAKLDEAMKERKTYEKLKEKAFEEFKKEISREEQKEIDELVSFRHGRT